MDYEPFRRNLRNLIDSRAILSKELAYDLNMTPASISRYLNGMRDPELPYVVRIADYFDVTVDWLLGLSGERYETLPNDTRELANLYQLAGPADREIVKLTLSKYKKVVDDND